MAPQVTFRFYEELNDFLPARQHKRDCEYAFTPGQTVKDAIEAQGVPHSEVDLILVNRESVGFDYQLQAGDRVSVYPVFESLDITEVSRVRPEPLRRPAFILDVHLGKLARRLRLLGLDTLYRNDYTDHQIVDIAARERRIILTRDNGLLQHRKVARGRYLRNTNVDRQVLEVLQCFDLFNSVKPFSRCSRCNGLLRKAEKESILHRLPPETGKQFDFFRQCVNCGHLYWRGSHMQRLQRWLRKLGITTSKMGDSG